MPVSVATDPLSCVVLGCASLLENDDLLERVKLARTN